VKKRRGTGSVGEGEEMKEYDGKMAEKGSER